MQKKWSLYLGKIAGIKVFIHWTFWILIIWIFMMYYQMGHSFEHALMGIVFIITLFACVVLHELGHALTARRFKIRTRDITIYPIGGVASLESMPEDPRQELGVAIAGPLVNIAIALILWIYLQSTGQMPDVSKLTNSSYIAGSFGFRLMVINVILAVFNMIPAFPMDGGRVLRALLAFKLDRGRATMIAARIGQLLAIVFVFLGFFYNFWLVFIGLFIFLGAGAESRAEMIKSALSHTSIGDVMRTSYPILHPADQLKEAVNTMRNSSEKSFLVMDNDNKKVMGVIGQEEIIHGRRGACRRIRGYGTARAARVRARVRAATHAHAGFRARARTDRSRDSAARRG